jgi:adenylosuccinate synthase
MANLVVIGAQWGDEGKGKIVDLLSEQADVVVRFGGGNNAGHTIVVQGRQVILHLIPSGILHEGKRVVLGDGMVIDPEALLAELGELGGLGVTLGPDELLVSSKAHLVLPYHRVLDELREGTTGALGTTRRGIGPAYEDKAARRGLRAGDLLRPERLARRLDAALGPANRRIEGMGGTPVDPGRTLEALSEQAGRLAPHITDTSLFLDRVASEGRRLLFEGAQGVLLDVDHGTYPFVTSSTTVGGGVSAGAGFPAHRIEKVVGVAKAYVTRVGDGPFPTEIAGAEGEALRKKGHEYGATTGRPRRCGWLDLPALRYAVRVGGVQRLAVTKLDVLAGVSPLHICTAYSVGGRRVEHFPPDVEDLEQAEPELVEVPGFSGDLSRARAMEDLPDGARRYLERLEREIGVPVEWVSVGPGREQTLKRQLPPL